ncbi:hypothetical protein O2313_05305 [Bacillus amyloliquefaciens]|uniref:hypothetical protein n=1 Tax=Bacillus amyloliquefaciens TaxID=1390 RepID=UPI0022B03947|nr:hypothetical protein [Bacillus amyloliquefaciens]MCZ4246949.1 hypothetical protein [Bacillus amyloliquefaciens]
MSEKTRKPSTGDSIGTDDLFSLMDKEFNKKFRSNPAQRLSDYRKDIPKLWYSTGIMTLDVALGGGLAGGRMSEWFGLEGSGKSTLLYSAIAESQRRHREGFHDYHVIADPENSSSDAKAHMELLGVDTSKVHIIAPQEGKPLYAEDIFERIEWILRHPNLKGRIGIIGIDSIGALVSKTEGENDKKWDKAARVGGISGVLSMFLRSVVDSGLLYEADAHLLMLNQVRDNIGDMYNPYRTPGGRKVHFTAAQRVEVARTRGADFKNPAYNSQKENSGEAMYTGQKIKFKQVKSKVGGRDGATASVDFVYGEGLDLAQNAIQVGQMHNIIVGSTWLSMIDVATGQEVVKKQGMQNMKNTVLEDEELYAKFDYMLTYVLRGLEPKSVVDEWEEIKATELNLDEDNALVENPTE